MRRTTVIILFASLFIHVSPVPGQADEGRTKVRLLYGFENAGDTGELGRLSENVDLTVVQDNGVTQGKNCCRVTIKRGADYGLFHLGAKASADWKDYDYFALDLYCDDDHPYAFNFELWDALSKNYATRFTQDLKTHKGRQTLLFPINRARRNGKEGRDWSELEPKDKINLNGLTRVKLFLTPRKDRDAIFWLDNLRLMQEDAAKPKMRVALPTGALAFDFGTPGAVVPGFKNVSAAKTWTEKTGLGFTDGSKRANGGEGWPDLLTGTFVTASPGQRMEFEAEVPNGEYYFLLAAGRTIRHDLEKPHFYLALNDVAVDDVKPSREQLCGPDFLYRFLQTRYSEKPHALWHNYIARMFPVHKGICTVRKGKITLAAENHFLGGLILVPAQAQAAAVQLGKDLEETRIKAFEQTFYTAPRSRPKAEARDRTYSLFVPHPLRSIVPWSGPAPDEVRLNADGKPVPSLRLAAAPGQRVLQRLAITPYQDAGEVEISPPLLRAASGQLGLQATRILVQEYRSDGKEVGEMCLMPNSPLELEKGVTRCYWLTIEVPRDRKADVYKGAVVLRVRQDNREVTHVVPLELEVYPFELREDLPLSLGMYFNEPHSPAVPPEKRRAVLKDLFGWMREIGFTGVAVPPPSLTGLKGDGSTTLRFDPALYEVAREVGMGARPEQYSMGSVLGLGRAIGRRLPGSQGATVDRNPGIELRQPEHRKYFLDALEQYRAFNDRMKLPVAVEVVDEPREVPNPWNRNLADTLTYIERVQQVKGLRGFVTPMGDSNAGKDYTILAEKADIVSVHAWKASSGLIRKAKVNGKTLWLYNTGMDRLSWGFYNWRIGSSGRWEWHFCWPEDQASGGYPGREWYNPFTSLHGLAPQAPWPKYRGGILFNSAFLNVAEGITDARYLFTLEETIRACKKAGTKTATVKEAEAFLEELRKAIPEFPELHGLSGAGDGALIGQGIKDSAAARAGEWRAKIAGFLTQLTR